MQKPQFKRYLLLPTGIIGVLSIMLVVLFSYTPNTCVPFPYIPPPPNGYYIETIPQQLETAFFGYYGSPESARVFIGEGFVFRNVEVTESMVRMKTETSIIAGSVQFVARYPSDLKELEVGDRVDIIGVCAGPTEQRPIVVLIENCEFLPPGLVPPLPGGPAVIIVNY